MSWIIALILLGILAMAVEAYAIGHNRGDLRPKPVKPIDPTVKILEPVSVVVQKAESETRARRVK